MSVADHDEPIEGVIPDIEDLSLHFAKTLTSPHNQDVSVLIVGQRGRGKSTAAISLAIETGKKLAEILGDRLEDHFTVDNIAIISKEEIIRLLKLIVGKKYLIVIYDDIGIGWSARNWQDEVNKILNDILQVFRTNKCLLILTIPDTFLIDKAPRKLVEYFVQMDGAFFDAGFTTAIVQKIVPKPKTGKTHYPYMRNINNKYLRYIFYKPDHPIYDEYVKRREAYANKMQEEKIARLENVIAEENASFQRLPKSAAMGLEEIADRIEQHPERYVDCKSNGRKVLKLGEVGQNFQVGDTKLRRLNHILKERNVCG